MPRFNAEPTVDWYRAAIASIAISVREYCAEAVTTKNRGPNGFQTLLNGGCAGLPDRSKNGMRVRDTKQVVPHNL